MKPNYQGLQAVLLDAGNTLMGMDHEFIANGLEDLGLSLGAADLARAEARSRPELSDYLGADRSTETDDARSTWIRMIFQYLMAPEHVDNWVDPVSSWIGTAETWDRVWKIVLPGVSSALERLRLRGLKLAVVSNSDGQVAQRLAEGGLAGYFDAIVDSALVGVEKPDPRIFEHAVQLLGVAPERCVHVGDMYTIDVVGANAAGVPGVLVDPHSDYADVSCDVFADLTAFEAALR